MDENLIYLDTYVLQQDMRIRMPKSILSNLNVQKGKTNFNIYFDKEKSCIVLKKEDNQTESNNE